MSKNDIDVAIEALKEASVNAAIGSIDYGINAKAIAMQAPEVIDRLREVLSKGYRLKGIEPITGFGSSLLDFRLRFRFESDNIIDVSAEDFVVSVELPTMTVNRILGSDKANQPATVPVPFVLAVPSQTRQLATPLSELVDVENRTRDFFQRQGIGNTAPRWGGSMTSNGKTVSSWGWCPGAGETRSPQYDHDGQFTGNRTDDTQTTQEHDVVPDYVYDENWDPP